MLRGIPEDTTSLSPIGVCELTELGTLMNVFDRHPTVYLILAPNYSTISTRFPSEKSKRPAALPCLPMTETSTDMRQISFQQDLLTCR